MKPITRGAMPTFYRNAWWISRWIVSNYFQWRVLHEDRVPLEGPVILAANHFSFADPPLVTCAAPRVIHFLARNSLFTKPLVGQFLRAVGSVAVDRDGGGAAGLRAIFDRLSSGSGIAFFPEGTRSSDGEIKPAKSGVGLVILKSSAPVIPVRLFGTFEAWGRHQIWPRPKPITIKFGHPIDFDDLRATACSADRKDLRNLYQNAADRTMAAISKLEPCEDRSVFP